jgi:hypothetical protein
MTAAVLEVFAESFPGVPAEVLTILIDGHPDYEPEGFTFEGEHQSYAGLAEELVDAGMYGEIPEVLVPHIDYESIGRDLDCGGIYEIRHNFVGYYWTIQ